MSRLVRFPMTDPPRRLRLRRRRPIAAKTTAAVHIMCTSNAFVGIKTLPPPASDLEKLVEEESMFDSARQGVSLEGKIACEKRLGATKRCDGLDSSTSAMAEVTNEEDGTIPGV
jgi:hypothetical protein